MDIGMVSIFPSLFDYEFIAVGILRIGLGLLVLSAGSRMLTWAKTPQSDARALGISATIVGLALTVGIYTQIAAILAGIIWSIVAFHAPRKTEAPVDIRVVYAFLALASLLLVFFGPGALAIDLPF